MTKKILITVFVSINIAPWLALFSFQDKTGLDLYCQVPFEIKIEKQQPVTLQGTIKTHYYPDRTAISFISGYLVKPTQVESEQTHWRINRRAEFSYQLAGDYLYSFTHQVHPAFGDNLSTPLAETYLFPTYKTQHRDYYQLTRLENQDVIVSIAGMPRLYCHSQYPVR